MNKEYNLCHCILTVLCSPVGIFCTREKCDSQLLLNILLYVFTFTTFGTIHAFHTYGLDLLLSILALVLPPLSLCCSNKASCIEIIICIILTCCFWIPGVIYAYWVLLT